MNKFNVCTRGRRLIPATYLNEDMICFFVHGMTIGVALNHDMKKKSLYINLDRFNLEDLEEYIKKKNFAKP